MSLVESQPAAAPRLRRPISVRRKNPVGSRREFLAVKLSATVAPEAGKIKKQ